MSDTYELREEYYECSIASSNETADNLPGHGRLLGNVYVFLGRHLEYSVGMVAGKMGFGPKAIAQKIRRIQENKSFSNLTKCRKLEKYSKRTARYLSSDVISNKEQALDNIINLGIMEPHLREMLRECAAPKIHQIQRMSTAWCRADGSVHAKAHRALTILNDSRVNYLVDIFFSRLVRLRDVKDFESARSELETYYTHPDYSFLVLRHMDNQFRKFSVVNWAIQEFLLAPFIGATNRSMDKIRYLDHAIEWSVFDEFLNISLMLSGIPTRPQRDTTHFQSKMIDVILRNADNLPLSIREFRLEWVQDLEAYRSDNIFNAFVILFNYHQFLQISPGYDPPKYTHEVAISVKRRLDNPLDMALAEICAKYNKEYINNNHDQNYSVAYIKLAEALNSDEQSIHQHALRNIGVVLSINRYTRRGILRALDSHVAPSKRSYRSLIEKMKPLIYHSKFPCATIFRHVDTRGRLIHLDYPTYYRDNAGLYSRTSRCNGECGAVEEHIMNGEDEIGEGKDYMFLKVKPEDPLSIAGHVPLFAGSAADDGALFVARGFLDGREIVHVVANGTRPRDLKYRTHYSDGSTREGDLYPGNERKMQVYCLRYDPFAYESNNNSLPGSDEIDATGPFSWRFSRKLPAERSEDEKRHYSSIEGPRIIWGKIIHQPKDNAHIQELPDDDPPSDVEIVLGGTIEEVYVFSDSEE